MKEYIGEKGYLFSGKVWELEQLIEARRKHFDESCYDSSKSHESDAFVNERAEVLKP